MLQSLSEAHAIGLVHRDLKPSNIFLCSIHGHRDFVKLLDFGIAKDTDGGEESDLTKTGFAVGTPKYMSPEQGRADKLDRRSDLYSLGVIMYEALCGEAPFKAPSAMSLIVKHMQEVPQSIDERVEGLPDGLAMIVMTALKKSPNARFYDADDMRAALEMVLARAGEPVSPTTKAQTAKMRGLTPDVVSAALAAKSTAASVAETREVAIKPGGDERPTKDDDEQAEAATRAIAAGAAGVAAGAAGAAAKQAFDPVKTGLGAPTERGPDPALAEAETKAVPTPAATPALAGMMADPTSAHRKHPSAPIMEDIGGGSIMPSSPSRPARNRPKNQDDGRSIAVLLLVVVLVAIAGVVAWQVFGGSGVDTSVAAGRARAMAAGREAVDFTKRASKAAVAAAQTAARNSDQRRGVRDKKGPKFKEDLAEKKAARKKEIEQAKAKGKTAPLTKKEVDKVGERHKGALRKCYVKYATKPANYKRIRIDVRIAEDGKVTDASSPESENDELAGCFEGVMKKARFRGKREDTESHQMFVNLGKIKSIRKKSPRRKPAPKKKKPAYDGDMAL